MREHPDLVRQYFMTEAVPAEYDKFAALNGALWSGGTFLYVPKNVDVALPLRALYTLTAGGRRPLHPHLVVVEEGARVTLHRGVRLDADRAAVAQRRSGRGVREAGRAFTLVTLQDWMGESTTSPRSAR